MAKKRDLYQQLAKRRAEKIPIRVPQHVKEFHCHLLPPQDVRQTLADGSKGKVEKVTSVLYARVKVAGLSDPIESHTVVEVSGEWTLKQEMEKAIRSAVFGAIEFLTKQCENKLLEKAGKEPEPELVEASAGKEVKNG